MRVQRVFLVLVLFAATLSAQTTTWADLERGNKRFIAGKLEFAKLDDLRKKLLEDGQHPDVTILACADSRVPPELLFDQTLGKLFVVRVAGNIADTFATGSIEYGVIQGYAKTLIVLGHEDCGAVIAAIGTGNPAQDALSALIQRIRAGLPPNNSSVTAAIKANAQNSVNYLLATSSTIRAAATRADKPIQIFAAYYSMKSGEVEKVVP